jgi:hypothetical protein
VPESRSRKKKANAAAEVEQAQVPAGPVGNPAWLVPTMLTLFIVGALWVVVYYLTSSRWGLPIPPIGQWNLAIGFVMILGGLGLATRWQ